MNLISPCEKSSVRIHTIDYMRALLALSILLYDCVLLVGYTGWGVGTLGKIGLYGVEAFYVISGISLGFIYRELTLNGKTLIEFGVRRFFRLAPVYWLTMIGGILLSLPLFPGLPWLILNSTLTFGLIARNHYLAGHGWSVGVEVVFYCLFPFVIVAFRKSRWFFAAIFAASLVFAWYYAFVSLIPTTVGEELAWGKYFRPENHLFFFLAGIALSFVIGRVSIPAWMSYSALAILMVVFMALPTGSPLDLVTGVQRLEFSALCILFCTLGVIGQFPLPTFGEKTLTWIGMRSYSIYLLHPIVYQCVKRTLDVVFGNFPQPALTAGLTISLTFILAHIVYLRLESPMILLGKRLPVQIGFYFASARAR